MLGSEEKKMDAENEYKINTTKVHFGDILMQIKLDQLDKYPKSQCLCLGNDNEWSIHIWPCQTLLFVFKQSSIKFKHYFFVPKDDTRINLNYLEVNDEARHSILDICNSSENETEMLTKLNSLVIELPDIETQNGIGEFHREYTILQEVLMDFAEYLEDVGECFDKDPLTYKQNQETVGRILASLTQDIYLRLMWPIFSSYHMAHNKCSENRLDDYYQLFESITCLNAIILLSALPNAFKKQYENEFSKNKKSYNKITFGAALALYEKLCELYRTQILNSKEYQDTLPLNSEFFQKITDKTIIDIIRPMIKRRNDVIHGGPKPDSDDAEKMIETIWYPASQVLLGKLDSLFNNVKLVQPLSMKSEEGMYIITAKKLGNSYPFPQIVIKQKDPMSTDRLYLISNGKPLAILPEFLNLHKCEECSNWSLYFYNKIQNKSVRYICYQTSEKHAHVLDVKGMLKSLVD